MGEWICLTCESQPELKPEEVYKHLKKTHGLTSEIKGIKTPTAFMDGKGFAIQVYEWQLDGGVKLRQTVEIKA